MTTAKLTRSERHLAAAIAAFSEALKGCTPGELIQAKAIAETLNDAQRQMNVLERRIRNRMEAEG